MIFPSALLVLRLLCHEALYGLDCRSECGKILFQCVSIADPSVNQKLRLP